ncbi:beta-galactosidase [Paenibacillus sp. 19GGS1-52]|uniref:beta-galactosidase n=1 Tax=Paenibacillus sp. 19GGS1-52 TaxID=2758563 RepID=UPI001EFC1CA3|nr:beta-galactosidase [Paenibacillus sp. 19GGS1-52]ULO09800.1 beta-galactosidase [Paenibacillus sp. 19GGS1-52]
MKAFYYIDTGLHREDKGVEIGMTHTKDNDELNIDLRGISKAIRPATLSLGGHNLQGDKISFTNYYMEWNGAPFFGICGEMHFSRIAHDRWEEGLLKMKAAGINIVATYIFWNHHEEVQGEFHWDGNLNLRKFIELCGKHGLQLILRVGPFCHGECRNGGLPDWLYGRPFEVRSNDEAYLKAVNILYHEIGTEAEGLMFKDGGPVIGVQLENEYQHAGAPWEMTNGQTNEFVPSGRDGEAHMSRLKEMAVAAGLIAPIYTSTGWGGAAVLLDEVLPLYGGYAYTPWNVTEEQPEQSPTTEFLFQDYHNNNVVVPGFEPPYQPEDYPYACCEMGGGMQAWYLARFQVEPETVEAMSIQKIAGGCNFIGYYVFHGGSQPVGRHSYMNEKTNPRISYDYQAPIGEFGQVRESYLRLKLLFSFVHSYGEELCTMATALPDNAGQLKPTDVDEVRFAVRVKEGSGYVFLTNVQDHVKTRTHTGISLRLELEDEILTVPESHGFTLESDVSAILPFNFQMGEFLLKYATAQPITCIMGRNCEEYFFFAPQGMSSEFCFVSAGLHNVTSESALVHHESDRVYVTFGGRTEGIFKLLSITGQTVIVHLLSHKQALNLWDVELWGERRLVLSELPLTVKGEELSFYSRSSGSTTFAVFPAIQHSLVSDFMDIQQIQGSDLHGFEHYRLDLPTQSFTVDTCHIDDRKAVVNIPPQVWAATNLHELFLAVDYEGDVGNASINGRLVGDHFWNGDRWELGLTQHARELQEHSLDLYISPARRGEQTRSDSAMAVQYSFSGLEVVNIAEISLIPEWVVRVKPEFTS